MLLIFFHVRIFFHVKSKNTLILILKNMSIDTTTVTKHLKAIFFNKVN